MGDVLVQDLWFYQVEGVEVESAVSEGELVIVRARTGGEQTACPACGTLSSRIHSRYVRRLADRAVGGRRVLIELQVRRFRCRERACRQPAFAEEVDGLTFRHGRRSAALQSGCEQPWGTSGSTRLSKKVCQAPLVRGVGLCEFAGRQRGRYAMLHA